MTHDSNCSCLTTDLKTTNSNISPSLNMYAQTVKDAVYINPKQSHRLITHEDSKFAHTHKIFGVLALSHFIYRLSLWYQTGNMQFTPTLSTLGWIASHAALHVTSFQFIIPNRRNQVYNIIWPEMRLHSMIFAYRALLVMLVIYGEQTGLVPSYLDQWLRGAIVMLTMVAADIVTKMYKGSTTMRGNPYPPYISKTFIDINNTFYSLSQLFATLNMLYRGHDLVFLTLIPIQTAPFLMTLEKKGIINQMGWHFWYTVALLIAYFYAITHMSTGNTVAPLAIAIAVARFKFRMNKYFLWFLVISHHMYKNHGHPDPSYAMAHDSSRIARV